MKTYYLILILILFSCNENDKTNCSVLKFKNGENVYFIKDSIKFEVNINYSIHANGHDTGLSGKLPCRYRISWLGNDGSVKDELVYDDELFKKTNK